MQFDPAGRRGDRLASVLGTPALDERHADGAHARQLVDGLESLRHGLRQQGGELLVIEDLQIAAGRYLTDGGRMPAVSLVAIRALYKDGRVAQAFGEHLAANIVQPHALANVTARLLDDLVAIHIGQQAEAEALRIGRIGEAVHRDRGLRGVKGFADARVQLVVGDGTPEGRLVVHHGGCIGGGR